MKSLRVLLAIMILSAGFFQFFASAHPGRTDSRGGHHDYGNVSGLGDYHYHHGYPAHLHTDGVCPYDFDDKTGQNSGSSSSSHSESDPAPSKEDEPEDSGLTVFLFLLGCGVCALVCFWAYLALSWRREAKKYEAEREKYLSLYGGKTVEELARMAGMPDGVEIGEDDLPKDAGRNGWGPCFTFYIAPSGKAFHEVCGCNRAAVHPIHAANIQGRSPCALCCPQMPDLSWYWAYKHIRAVVADYKIEIAKDE